MLLLHYDLGVVERGPLPPHERTWRHPSELAAEERAVLRAQAAAPSTRAFALTTGTLGLLAVGVLIMTVTPRRQESPIAISATTSPAVVAAAVSANPVDGGSRSSAPVPAFAPRSPAGARTGTAALVRAAATPIGDGRLVVVTRAALDGDRAKGDSVEVLLPSGAATSGDVVAVAGDAIVVEIGRAAVEPGHDIAEHRPHDREIVIVMASPPIEVAYGDVDELEVDEGTAVLDDEGSLVGLCSRSTGAAGVRLIEISDAIGEAATVGG